MTRIYPMPFCVICLVLFSMHFVSSARHILRSMNGSTFYMQYERLLNRKIRGKTQQTSLLEDWRRHWKGLIWNKRLDRISCLSGNDFCTKPDSYVMYDTTHVWCAVAEAISQHHKHGTSLHVTVYWTWRNFRIMVNEVFVSLEWY